MSLSVVDRQHPSRRYPRPPPVCAGRWTLPGNYGGKSRINLPTVADTYYVESCLYVLHWQRAKKTIQPLTTLISMGVRRRFIVLTHDGCDSRTRYH